MMMMKMTTIMMTMTMMMMIIDDNDKDDDDNDDDNDNNDYDFFTDVRVSVARPPLLSKNQWLSRNPADFRCLIGTNEALSFLG